MTKRDLTPPPINPELVNGPTQLTPDNFIEFYQRPRDHGWFPHADPTYDVHWVDPPVDPPANPKTLMGNKKVRNLSVIPMTALIQEARAMEYGAFHSPRADGTKGYGPFNWRDSNIEYMTYVEAAFRHIMAAADREDIDPETGEYKVPHLALARATLGILIDALEHGTVIDNRPKNARGVVAELLRKYRKSE